MLHFQRQFGCNFCFQSLRFNIDYIDIYILLLLVGLPLFKDLLDCLELYL